MELIIFIIILILMSIPVGTAVSGSNNRYRQDRVKTVHLWYGTAENGDVFIDIRKFIIYAQIEKCPDEWRKSEPFRAVAAVIRKSGDTQYVKFTARLCEDGSVYFITQEEYSRISKYGKLIGMVMPLPDYRKIGKGISEKSRGKLADQSKFKLFGYNVSQKDGYSAEYRQKLLMFMLESGLTSKYEALSFLDFNISYHAHNPNDRLAVSKWEADRLFLSTYTFGSVDVNWVTTSNPPDVETIHVQIRDVRTNQSGVVASTKKTNRKTSHNNPKTTPQSTISEDNIIREKKSANSNNHYSYSVGQEVKHRTFGIGEITSIDNDNNRVFIQFGDEEKVRKFSTYNLEQFLE